MSMRLAPAMAAFALAALAAPLPGHAAGKVEVNFIDSKTFADIGFNAVDRERVLKSLSEFLQTLGQEQLPDGQVLKLDITNINLAGELKFTPRGDIRVMRGRADWPVVDLRYTLSVGTQTLKSGEAKVYDMAYLDTIRTADLDTEYGYEKRMLRRWFKQTFAAQP